MKKMSKAQHHFALSDIPAHYSEPIDLFICAASFEDRSLSVARQLPPSQVRSVLVCSNTGIQGDNATQQHKNFLLNKFGLNTLTASLPVDNPLLIADNIAAKLDALLLSRPTPLRLCLVDITAFTQEALLILLQLVVRKLGGTGCEIDFIYTAANDYSVNEGVKSKKWLSSSIGAIRSVLGYSGEFDPAKPLHLIILMGIEVDKTVKLINTLEPAKLSFGLGRKYTSVKLGHTELSQLNYDKLPIARSATDSFAFSCTSPSQTFKDLANYIAKFPEYNTIIAPQNTKLSTMGAGLFAMENPDVQLCYAPANKYNIDGYSAPDDFCYIYSRKFKKPSGMID